MAVVLAAFGTATSAQTTLTPLNTLIGNKGSLVAGDITFSNFSIPNPPPASVTVPFSVPAPMPEFGDIAVSAEINADGTVSLNFVAIDPATGLPSPLTVSPAAGGDKFREAAYTMTVTNPALRVRAVDQAFGPGATISGDSNLLAGLYAVEPVPAVWDTLLLDTTTSPPQITRATSFPSADGSAGFSGIGGIFLPGGNMATYNMASAFGFIKGHLGFPAGGTLDSLSVKFTLVAANTSVPLVVPSLSLYSVNDSSIGSVLLTDFAQDGGAVVSLASGNPAAQSVPDSVTVPQGYKLGTFQLPPATVDAPTAVVLTATYNGQTIAANGVAGYTAVPTTPLVLTGIAPSLRPVTAAGATLRVGLNRETFSGASVQLTSSNPALAPVPASVTIPAFGTFFDFDVPFQPVAVNTPVTITATFNGGSVSTTVTIPAPIEIVRITKAEYVVSKSSLKVEATDSNPAASLSLTDANTGAFVGTMTFGGLSGGGSKFSFQGTVPQVFTLRATSETGATFAVQVSQK
jgi:hypothetical protein